MKINTALVLSALFCSSLSVSAETVTGSAFSVDPPFPFKNIAPFYKADQKKPERSTFIIENQVFLSNDLGERQAVVTINNSATSLRMLSGRQLMAVFANGDKHFPQIKNVKILAGESVSFVFNFGIHRFPIMFISTEN